MGDDATLVMKPSTGFRTLGWALVAFGAIFGLSGTAAGNLPTAIVMGLFGFLFLLGGVAQATARVDCNSAELRYRTLRIVRVSASEVAAVTVKTVPGAGYRRVRIDVHRRTGRTVKLNWLQRPSTSANLAKAEADAEAIRRELGLHSPA
jgi:hypothetical protein